MRRPSLRLAIAILVGGVALDAHALAVLTVGKTAVFRRRGDVASAVVRFGRDPAFATVTDPTCAGGGSARRQGQGLRSRQR